MRFVDGYDVIQQFATATADPALGDAVLLGTAHGGPDRRDVHRANGGGNFGAVLGIVIQDEKLRYRFVGETLRVAAERSRS